MTSRIVLFGSRVSPFVEKIVRALGLKNEGFELVEPRRPAQFHQWNPQTAKMPVLEIDGERIVDSTFIARRLDELFPQPPLLSPIAIVAAAQRLLEDWSDESLYWYAMTLRWTGDSAAATAQQVLGSVPAPIRQIAKYVVTRRQQSAVQGQGLGRLPRTVVLRELARHLDDLVVLLDDKPFFYSRQISIADLALYGQFHTLRSGPTPEAAELLDERPALLNLMRRIETATER
jgi:glutathione S-transferase